MQDARDHGIAASRSQSPLTGVGPFSCDCFGVLDHWTIVASRHSASRLKPLRKLDAMSMGTTIRHLVTAGLSLVGEPISPLSHGRACAHRDVVGGNLALGTGRLESSRPTPTFATASDGGHVG